MNSQKEKIIRFIPVFEAVICIIAMIVSFLIRDIPAESAYTYTDGCIVTHSWHDLYSSVLAIVFLIIACTTILCIVMRVIEKIKGRKLNVKHIFACILSFLFCSAALMISGIIVTGAWTKEDHSPRCYEFTDHNHTIVIEETSFLLSGGGTVYQINDQNEAVIIHKFSTDDGGRNNGNYEISWHDDYAEITYHTFNTNDSTCTDKIMFVQ